MSEFTKSRATEEGQIEIARAILSLKTGEEYVPKKGLFEFMDKPASEHGQKEIARALRFLGDESEETITVRGREFASNPASVNGQKEIINAILSLEIGGNPKLENKTVKSTTTQQTVTAGEGYDGIGTVTVSPIVLETKTVKSTTTSQTVDPTSGKDGISQITVSPIVLETVNVTLGSSAQEITPSSGYDGIGTVNVPAVPAPNLQSKSVTPSNTSQTVTADTGYDGLSSVVVGADSGTDTLAQAFTSNGVAEYTLSGASPIIEPKVVKANFPNVTTIMNKMFNNKCIFEEVNLPNATSIDNNGFYGASSIQKISAPNLVYSNQGTPFYQLGNLVELNAPTTIDVTNRTDQFMSNCGPSHGTSTIDFTFTGTTMDNTNTQVRLLSSCNVRDVTFSGITSITGPYTQPINRCRVRNLSCPDLVTVGNPNGNSGVFSDITVYGTINMPKLVTANKLTFGTITLDGSDKTLSFPLLETVGNQCFQRISSLTSIRFPKLTTIGTQVFQQCYNLTDIYLGGTTLVDLPNVNVFNSCTALARIHVRSDLETTYKEATNWTTYADKIVGDYTD